MMHRRQFIKTALLTSGIIGAGGFRSGATASENGGRDGGNRAESKGLERIDVYSHFSSLDVLSYLEEKSGIRPHPLRALFANTATLLDAKKRLQLMEEEGVSHTVLVPLPWIELTPPAWTDPAAAKGAATLLNNQLAEIAARSPKKFSAVALLPTTNVDVMLSEFDRSITTLGMKGGFIVVGPTVKPPDHADYWQLYKRAEELDVPLWLHPSRPPNYPDYVGEPASKWQIWQALSWVLDSSQAMVRLVFAGVFEKHPNLKLIIHHHGALIPLFAQRMQNGWDYFEKNTNKKQPTPISSPYINHFKKFYCDTATQGHEPAVLQLAYDFFGPDRVLFGADAPMDASDGRLFTRGAVTSLEGVRAPQGDLEKMFSGNAKRLLKL